MIYIYIIEDEERIQKELFDTIKSIDAKLCLRYFYNLNEFHDWLKIAMQDGSKALATGGHQFTGDPSPAPAPEASDELRLVIAKDQFLGIRNMDLMKRSREFFIRKKICTREDPTALMLTAFTPPDFDIRLLEARIVNNVIFKPFDKLILKQHIEYALTGRHPVEAKTIAAMKVTNQIEMLKLTQTVSISELGFSTYNNHPIAVGAMAKYYCDFFKTDRKKSVLARCKSCEEVSPGQFLTHFTYFGIDNLQVSTIRRAIFMDKQHIKTDYSNPENTRKIQVLVLDPLEKIALEIKDYLEDKLSNVETTIYQSNGQLLSDLADKESEKRQVLPTKFDFVFANYDFFEGDRKAHWEEICKALADRGTKYGALDNSPPTLYLISPAPQSTETLRELSTWCADVFYILLEKSYLYKKLITLNLNFSNKEPANIVSLEISRPVKVANPADITEISEAGLVLKYHRSMAIGSFREFILGNFDALDNPEVLGTVNFHEPAQGEEGGFLNHFVFFGVTDLYLKYIRLWLRESYIKGKDQES